MTTKTARPTIRPNAAGDLVAVEFPCGGSARIYLVGEDAFAEEWRWVATTKDGTTERGRSRGKIDRAVTNAWCAVRVAPDAIPSAESADLEGIESLDRSAYTKRLRAALKARTGRAWSVTGSTGTAYGWIKVGAPKKRLTASGDMTADDESLLASVLIERRGIGSSVSIPPTRGYRTAVLAAALGIPSTVECADHSWD